MKQIKIKSPEYFKELCANMLQVLQAYSGGLQINAGFTNEYICEFNVGVNPFQSLTYSVWVDRNTDYAEWCVGKIGKYPDRNIN